MVEAVLFLRGHTVFWKWNIPSQILQIRTEDWVSREGQFSKKGIFRHKYLKFSKLRQKNWVFKEGVARFMLTGYTFTKFCEKESSVKLKFGKGCSPLWLHQGIEKKKTLLWSSALFFFWPRFLLFKNSGYQCNAALFLLAIYRQIA